MLNGQVTEAENPSLKAALKMIAANQKEKPREPEEQLSMAEGAMLVLDRLVGEAIITFK